MNKKRIVISTVLIVGILLFSNFFIGNNKNIQYGEASWYGKDPIKERLNKNTAWNIPFNSNLLECASWDYKFGTVLKVTNQKNGKVVYVRVTDRGPAKRLVKEGRIIDLTVGAFKRIADLKLGLIKVQVKVVKRAYNIQ